MANEKIRVLLVEDDENYAEVMRVIYNASDEYELVGVASSHEEFCKITDKKDIDIAVVDLELGEELSGLDVVKTCTEKQPEALILVNTVHEDSRVLFDALRAGARGYILKGSSPVELFEHLKKLYNGEVPMSPKIARRVLQFFREGDDNSGLLTDREKTVLEYADKGYTYNQTAEMMGISRYTVHTHYKNIYSKLHVKSKKGAIKKAKDMTII
ncbi:response regulator [Limisalsivibrio acetivorans]|uniref:response regulator n=1 Tax=Limisalsivibrio acetivorans TaxID=1304888 RepID=UPI0003B5BF5C|nr:response regulator transcription factor [Limisalsivibrio acetivorans]